MRRRARPGRGKIRLRRIGLTESHQFRDGFDRAIALDDQHVRHGGDARHPRQILERVEGKPPIERGPNPVGRDVIDVVGIAIWRRTRRHFRPHHAARPWARVYDHGLAEPFAQPVFHHAEKNIGNAARGTTNHEAQRLIRPGALRLHCRCRQKHRPSRNHASARDHDLSPLVTLGLSQA